MEKFFYSYDKNKNPMDVVAIVLCVFALLFWVILLSYKFFHFGYYDWDLAFFAQGMWSLSHGSGYVSLFGTNLLANHANLIAYFIIPLYKIFSHPLTLVFLKVISFVTSAFVLYLLAKEKVGSTAAVIFVWLYLIYTPNLIGMVYEFDFESLAPGFLMLIFYFYEKDRWLGFLICAVFLILIKENLPLIVLAFSIHGLFVKKDKIRWAIVPGTLALVSFYLLVFIFIPYFSGRPIGAESSSYYIGQDYKEFGGSVGGLLSSILFHPIRIWHVVMSPLNFKFLSAIFVPFIGLPLTSPGILFLISPILLQHLLSSSPTEHMIRFAYILTISPFLFLGTIETLSFVHKKRISFFHFILTVLIFLNVMCLYINVSNIKSEFMKGGSWELTNEMVNERWELLHMIPPGSSVISSFCYLAPLSQRMDLYAFYKIYDSHFQNDQGSFVLPSNVQYALIDYNDPWLLHDMYIDPVLTRKRVDNFFIQYKWNVIQRYGKIALYERIK